LNHDEPVLLPLGKALGRYLRRYRLPAAVTVLGSTLAAGLETLFPILLGWLVDTLGGKAPEVLGTLESWGFADPHSTALWLLPTAMAAVTFAAGFFSFLGIYASARLGLDLTARVRRACLRKVLTVPYSDFTRSKTGELLSRVHENTQGFLEATVTLREATQDALTVALVGTVVMLRHWQLGLYLMGVFALLAVAVGLVNRHQRRYSERVADTSARILGYAGERLSAIEVVACFGAAGRESVKFTELARRYFKNRLKGEMITSAFRGLVQLVAGVGLMGMLIYGAGLVRGGAMTTGSLFEFLGLVAIAFEPLKGLSRARLALVPAGIQIGRTNAVLAWPGGGAPEELPLGKGKLRELPNPQFLDAPTETGGPAGAVIEIEGELCFEDVEYETGGERILDGVGFTAPPGKVTAFAGPSGVGKSTLLNLALGLLEPTKGRVLLDGQPRYGYDQAALARLQALVPQEITLTAGSVAENLRLARPGAVEDELWEKLELAQVDDAIRRLPDGLASEIGERGCQLSGGEGQRLAIARALLRDPRILALDEPTANLDSQSEDWINAALARVLPGRTVLVVAHRLATVRDADRIIFIEGGRVVETGTHGELMEKNGRYAELARLQSADER
jgi:ABC-type multidrug transport system fused ATPase/permease subunit